MSKMSKQKPMWVPVGASKELLQARSEDRLMYCSCLNDKSATFLLEADMSSTGIFEAPDELSSYKLVMVANQALVSYQTTFAFHVILPAPRTSYSSTAYFRFALQDGTSWAFFVDGTLLSPGGLEKAIEERGGRKYPTPAFTSESKKRKRVAAAPTEQQKRLRQAEREGRVATIRGNNVTKLPLNLSFDHSRVRLENVLEGQADFELHMVTRRTMLNPGEYFVAKVILQQPVAELPETSSIRLPLHKEQVAMKWSLSLKGLSTDELNAKLEEQTISRAVEQEANKGSALETDAEEK